MQTLHSDQTEINNFLGTHRCEIKTHKKTIISQANIFILNSGGILRTAMWRIMWSDLEEAVAWQKPTSQWEKQDRLIPPGPILPHFIQSPTHFGWIKMFRGLRTVAKTVSRRAKAQRSWPLYPRLLINHSNTSFTNAQMKKLWTWQKGGWGVGVGGWEKKIVLPGSLFITFTSAAARRGVATTSITRRI